MLDSTTSASLSEIVKNLQYLRHLNTPFYFDPNFLGALLASTVALAIALFGEPIKKLWQYTRLEVVNICRNVQGSETIYYRLLLKNIGNSPIKDCEVHVEQIFDEGKERSNFLPVPLRWTHASAYMQANVYRNIHPNQAVLLDFCEFIPDRNLIRLFLAAGGEVGEYSIITTQNTKVVLKAYQESGQTVKISVLVHWQGLGHNPEVSIVG